MFDVVFIQNSVETFVNFFPRVGSVFIQNFKANGVSLETESFIVKVQCHAKKVVTVARFPLVESERKSSFMPGALQLQCLHFFGVESHEVRSNLMARNFRKMAVLASSCIGEQSVKTFAIDMSKR